MVRVVHKNSVIGSGGDHSACANAFHSHGVTRKNGQEVCCVHIYTSVVDLDVVVNIVATWTVVYLHSSKLLLLSGLTQGCKFSSDGSMHAHAQTEAAEAKTPCQEAGCMD
jgi:hypothetical protein